MRWQWCVRGGWWCLVVRPLGTSLQVCLEWQMCCRTASIALFKQWINKITKAVQASAYGWGLRIGEPCPPRTASWPWNITIRFKKHQGNRRKIPLRRDQCSGGRPSSVWPATSCHLHVLSDGRPCPCGEECPAINFNWKWNWRDTTSANLATNLSGSL